MLTFILFFFFVGPIPIKPLIGKSDSQGGMANIFLFLVINLCIPIAYGLFFLVLKLFYMLFKFKPNFFTLLVIALVNQVATYYLIWILTIGSDTY